MNYINIDARGCGAGKTQDTIIPQIKQNIQLGIQTLLVVPSINLQRQYAQYFDITQITVINSDTHDQSVSEQLTMATTPVVCITHQGFLLSEHRNTDNVALIIDEAFDPYGQVTFNTHNEKGIALVDLSSVVEWKVPEVVPANKPQDKVQPFYEVEIDNSRAPDLMSRKFAELQNPNLRVWATWSTYNNLKNKTPETTTLYTEYDARKLLGGWSSVWIAAAAFEKTLMGAWLDNSTLADAEVVYPFEKHSAANLTVHRPVQDFSLSKTFITQDKGEMTGKFRDYINTNRTGKLFYNTNNDSALRFMNADRITHNAHGLNGYTEYTEYAFASAIKPSANYRNFLAQRTGMNKSELEFAFAGYTAYQLLMRSALRDRNNSTQVNAYFMDTYQLNSILELFDNDYTVKHIEGIERTAKKVAMTSAERVKAFRQKQSNGIKKAPKTAAQRAKEYRARKKAAKQGNSSEK